MAVPSDSSIIPEKMQYLARPADLVHHPNRQWQVPDERDSFIFWLRGEFAAANAIIDSLCHHLRTTAEPGDYDFVISCIQQRRFNWTPVLHMQQYFSIADVTMALQQITWQKQQQRSFEHPKPLGRDSRRPSFGHSNHRNNGGNRFESGRENNSFVHPPPMAKVNSDKMGEKFEKVEFIKQRNEHVHTPDQRVPTTGAKKEGSEATVSSKMDCSLKDDGNVHVTCNKDLESQTSDNGGSSCSSGKGDNLSLKGGPEASSGQDEKTPLPPKVFFANEMCDGKMVNTVEGLKLYEGLFDSSKITEMLSMANELRVAGKRGDLQGLTFIASKRPCKGHGREIIQLGVPMHDGHVDDENSVNLSRERKVEAIPVFFQGIFVRLVQLKILSAKPDFCIIDFFNEGDYSHPYAWLPFYGRPIANLSLTECDMVFGRTINVDNKGEYRGPLRLSLAAGSMLLVEGKSVDLAKRAISALHKPRIILTFGKAQSKRPLSSDVPRLSSATAVPLPLGPPPGRQMSHPRRPPGSKHYGVVPTSCVLQATHCRPQQLAPSNEIQPLFVTQTPGNPSVVPFPISSLAPTSNGWTVSAQPRPPATPRPPIPGTGVFLPPPGSSPLPSCQQLQSENSNPVRFSSELCSENDKGAEKSHSGSVILLKDRGVESGTTQNHNGKFCGNITTGDREEQATSLKKKQAKSDAAAASAK